MDAIDGHIIRLLQQDARTPVSDISKAVKLSAPAVSERIRKLTESGLIREFTAILEPGKLGKKLTALLFLTLRQPERADQFLQMVQENDEILECHYLTGDFDYMIKIVTCDTMALENLLSRLKSFHEFSRTRTIIVLSTLKERHSVLPGLSEKEDDPAVS